MKKLTIIIASLVITGGVFVGYYIYNKPHVNVKKEKIDLQVTVDEVANDFLSNREQAIGKYSDKIILLTGKFHTQSLSHNNLKTIIVKGSESLANCEMDSLYSINIPSLQTGNDIMIKGLFVGYDDLLNELQLKKCLFIENRP